MKQRSIILTMIAFVALIIGGSIQAQDDMPDIDLCFGLSETDCTVINEASMNGLGDADSFTLDFEIDFAGDELTGFFGLISGFAPELDLGEIADFDAATFTSEGTINVTAGDAEDMSDAGISGSFVTTFSQNDGEITEIAMDFVAVGDLLYVDVGDGWQSIDPEALEDNEALAERMDMLDFAGMMDADDMEMEDMDDDDVVGDAFGTDGLVGLFELIELPGFVTYERAGDIFTFNIDFSVLQSLLEEENEDLLNELVVTASEIDPAFAFLIPLLPTLINDGAITVVQTVDTDSNIVTDLDFSTTLDLALGVLEGSEDVTNVDLTANFSLSNINAVAPIEAPADAVDATDDFAEWLLTIFPEPMEDDMEETEDSDD